MDKGKDLRSLFSTKVLDITILMQSICLTFHEALHWEPGREEALARGNAIDGPLRGLSSLLDGRLKVQGLPDEMREEHGEADRVDESQPGGH